VTVPERDRYARIAETYDLMLPDVPERRRFFARLFERNKVRTVLDCACGTGVDLSWFSALGLETTGSDLSEAMLRVARKRLKEEGRRVVLRRADYQSLSPVFKGERFDAVVCLSNAINEAQVDVHKALRSMRSVLDDKGIIVFDQGQTDASMKTPPPYSLMVNTRDFTRLFTMDYGRDIMLVRIYDILHSYDRSDIVRHEFPIKIRLLDDWKRILARAGLRGEFYSWWDFRRYDKRTDQKLIVVARQSG
jgi:glycine/sarcosine N-methyltransferase